MNKKYIVYYKNLAGCKRKGWFKWVYSGEDYGYCDINLCASELDFHERMLAYIPKDEANYEKNCKVYADILNKHVFENNNWGFHQYWKYEKIKRISGSIYWNEAIEKELRAAFCDKKDLKKSKISKFISSLFEWKVPFFLMSLYAILC